LTNYGRAFLKGILRNNLPGVMKLIYPLMIFFATCSEPHFLSVEIAKWRDNHQAAISINADIGDILSPTFLAWEKLVTERKMSMDIEIVTANYEKRKDMLRYLKDVLIPSGFGTFGHGHTHVNHDHLSFEKAKESFQRCFDSMKKMELNPVAYAYPEGAGLKNGTRRALAKAGFLSGRLYCFRKKGSPFIMPEGQQQPQDWYGLPSLAMEDSSVMSCGQCINNNEDLIPFLDGAIKKKAWLIMTYHNIGNPKGWGFYQFEEFRKDLDAIKLRDFWNASLNDITLYTFERGRVGFDLKTMTKPNRWPLNLELILNDGLENTRFNIPLTIKIRPNGDWTGRTLSVYQGGLMVTTQYVHDTTVVLLSLLPNEKSYTVVVR